MCCTICGFIIRQGSVLYSLGMSLLLMLTLPEMRGQKHGQKPEKCTRNEVQPSVCKHGLFKVRKSMISQLVDSMTTRPLHCLYSKHLQDVLRRNWLTVWIQRQSSTGTTVHCPRCSPLFVISPYTSNMHADNTQAQVAPSQMSHSPFSARTIKRRVRFPSQT